MPDSGNSDDVLVVGGGPAGSATALRLSRLGHRVRLIERAAFPREKACAEYLSPATLHSLKQLQLSETGWPRHAAAITATTVHASQGSQLTGCFGSPLAGDGLALRRSVLDSAVLAAAIAAGVMVETGQVRELVRDARGVKGVVFQDASGRTLQRTARLVVAADGLRSLIARRTGMRVQGRLRRLAFSAHLRGIEGMTSVTEMHVGHCGYVGLNRLGNGVTNVSLVVPADDAAQARGKASEYFLRRLAEIPALRDRVQRTEVVREVMVTGPFHASCRRATGDGFLLVGDAAEFFDPFTGDGIHTALLGAELAAQTIHSALQDTGRVEDRHLRAYRRSRRQAFGGKWLIERLIGYGMEAPLLFDRVVGRLARKGAADLLIGVTGHEVSPWRVLNPFFLARMMT